MRNRVIRAALSSLLATASAAVPPAATAAPPAAAAPPPSASAASDAHGAYRNFRVAIYIPVESTRRLADERTLERQYARISSQLRFDKVYLEAYRNGVFAQ